MTMLPAVVIHGIHDAVTALAPGSGVLLLSARGAALFAGAGWWRAVVAGARAAHPDTPCEDALDCADAPGRALEALATGCRIIILDPGCAAFARVAAIAAANGAVVWTARPASLDLAMRGAARSLPQWLGSPPNRDRPEGAG